MTFLSKLLAAQRANNSLLCIGLDTDTAKLPVSLRNSPDPQFEFNKRVIEATRDMVCAYKINSSFYEAEGGAGWRAMRETLRIIPANLITIADVKRGDIGNSSERYAKIFLDEMKFDAVTVNPYMGKDSVAPFLRSADQCAFVLALTSNAGSKDFQKLKAGKKFLYEHVVATALKWNTKKNVGFVAGATNPKELQAVRKLAPSAPLLIPGVGAQGGNVRSTVRFGCDQHGELAIINASRSILYASSGEDFAGAARDEAMKLREEINHWRGKYFRSTGDA